MPGEDCDDELCIHLQQVDLCSLIAPSGPLGLPQLPVAVGTSISVRFSSIFFPQPICVAPKSGPDTTLNHRVFQRKVPRLPAPST